jgi:hypothetical protein
MIANVDRGQINAQATSLVKTIDRTFLQLDELKTFLDGITDGDLIAIHGYVQADINDLRSALNDMQILALVYRGTQPQASVKDFRLFAKRIWGLGSLF